MAIPERFIPHYTYEDYKQWEGDWELIDGTPFAMAPSPLWKHQRISLLLAFQIEEQIENCQKNCKVCQEVDWVVNEETVVRPDILVICDEVEDFVRSTPEVIFEIVSSSTAFKDERIKFELYKREKVKYYGLVYPKLKKMRVFMLKNGEYDKVFDSDKGKFTFEIDCPFSVDIGKVWKRV